MNDNFQIGQESTQEYFSDIKNIKPGDRLSEMLSFWVTIIKLKGDKIITLEGTSNLELKEYDSFESFRKRFEYSHLEGKYWVDFMGNQPSLISRVIEIYKNNNFQDKVSGNRQINIDSILYDL